MTQPNSLKKSCEVAAEVAADPARASVETRRTVKSRAKRASTSSVKCPSTANIGLLISRRPSRIQVFVAQPLLPALSVREGSVQVSRATRFYPIGKPLPAHEGKAARLAKPRPTFRLKSPEPKKARHAMNFLLRPATLEDIPRLREIIHASVRTLQAPDYTPAQLEGALHSVYGVDTQLIADGTYFAVEAAAPAHESRITNHESLSPSPAADGANAKLSSAAINSPSAKTRSSIPPATPPKFAPSSSIPNGPAAASAP